MGKFKPFSRTELNLLINKKMKHEGMDYEHAYKEVANEIDHCINTKKKVKETKEKEKKEFLKDFFKQGFKKMK
jgi:hypothetical protein